MTEQPPTSDAAAGPRRIKDTLSIYSHNVRKTYSLLNIILELRGAFDILLIQEPPWKLLQHTASMNTSDGDEVWGPPIHPDWILIVPVRIRGGG